MKFSCVQLSLLLASASAFYVQQPARTCSTFGTKLSETKASETTSSNAYTYPFTFSNGSLASANVNGEGKKVERVPEVNEERSYKSPYTFPSGSANVNSQVAKRVSEDYEVTDNKSFMKKMWETLTPTIVQGGSLRTWAFATPDIERVNVMLRSDGRPLHASVELWQGPDNTPVKMNVYNEDGCIRQFAAVIETPQGQNSIAIRNTGQMEFPLSAALAVDVGGSVGKGKADLGSMVRKIESSTQPKTIQGGAVQTFPFQASVSSVQVMISTDGRPLNARLELLQGPNNIKQVIDLYCEDGRQRPFYAVFETPGTGNVIRVVNTATLEFPMNIRITPFEQNILAKTGGADSYFTVM